MMKRFAFMVVAAAAAAGFVACSDDETKTPATGTGDGGASGTDSGGGGGNTAKFSGQMEGYSSKGPVAEADVTAGSASGKTDSKGVFELNVEKNKEFNLKVSKSDFFTLVDQEMKIAADADLPKLRFVDKGVGNVLLGALKANAAKGVVSVGLKATSDCETKAGDFPQGAKVTVEGQPDAKVVYYKATPDPSLTEGQKGEDPAAVIFNANPDEPLTIKVEYTKCSQQAWPHTDENGITYTGKIVPKAPETLSVYRVFFN